MNRQIIAPDDGETPVMYTARRLIADGFVRSQRDIYHKIKTEGFPEQVKSNPADPDGRAVEWHGASVRAWHRAKLERIRALVGKARHD